MSEHGVGAGERAVLGRAAAAVLAQRRGYFRRLEAIAALADSGVAAGTGYRSLESLLADRDNLDHTEAKRLVAEAAELCPRASLLGEVLPAVLPCTGAALAAGVIDPGHVRVIRETMTRLSGLVSPPPPEVWAGVERTLAEHAELLPPRMLRVLAKKFLDAHDPDGAAPPPEGEDARDEVVLLRRRDGSLVFKGRLHDPLDAEAAVEVFGVLSAPAGAGDERSLEQRQADAFKDLVQDARGPRGLATDTRHETDDDATRDDATDDDASSDDVSAGDVSDVGDDATDATDATDADKAGDGGNAGDGDEPGDGDNAGDGDEAAEGDAALDGEDTRGGDEPADDEPAGDASEPEAPWALIPEPRRASDAKSWTERPGRALLTVTIDHRWLCEALKDTGGYGTLDSGHRVDAATVRRWACDAEILPMILGSRSEPLDVGRAQRTAPDAIRRALNLRDGGCAFPGCTRRPRRCAAHHIAEWFRDRGATAVENMCLLCRYHHQLVHHGDWTITMTEGRPWFTPPWYIDTTRRPRPGGRPRAPT